MTNLTEQWKKSELPDGEYYCETENGVEILRTWRSSDGYMNFENICNEVFISNMDDCKVLAEVPSFEQWQAKLEENTKLKTENKWYSEQLNEAVKEVGQLKELLTMVKPVLQLEYNVTENRNLIKKINQVLGEE